MALADYSHEVDQLVAEGATTQAALAQVALAHGTTQASMQSAYYRNRQKRGIGRGKRRGRRAPSVIPAAALDAPSLNGKASIEELIGQLKVNHAENERIMTQLEALVWEHTQRLAEVRAALTA